MNRLLPHLFYLTAIGGLAFFLWWRVEREKQAIEFLNEPTDEACLFMARENGETKRDVLFETKAYPSEGNMEYGRRIRYADSLIIASWASPSDQDSLARRLETLTRSAPQENPVFQTLLPPGNRVASLPEYRAMLEQNDSLRRKLAFREVLKYFDAVIGAYDLRFDHFDPIMSVTTLCPTVGSPFQADIFLGTYPVPADIVQISVNDQPLTVENDEAHYRRIFPQAGVYPLRVQVTYREYAADSATTCEKTFFLHVNR